ncbi:ETC complex I subunit conserved region family protein [Orientia chuto str. Dubai]|uniref:ETC complex I subunit conserved region family protein n=1 Tax=Orientia chuto str. Dubai TaxID=1359168 RepID=A0A0F3MLF7_9RICK|nr:NADH dehydrogenase ubiquinone Fe-S protein 4 [Candidatus Orientia mediorientalis]KJV56550.1 ETC complex I subunit conserved region family protein [Orientia chuto str. Dubai]
MQVRIYQLSKSPTQSGLTSKLWVVDFYCGEQNNRFIDRILGWTGTTNPQAATIIHFNNKSSAVKFCLNNYLDYELITPKPRKLIPKSYAENFK